MTISEYYEKYKNHRIHPNTLPEKTDITIDAFYNNCIDKNILPKDNVLAWHNMLLKYVKRNDAVFWIRYHENGPKDENSGRYKTRRGCKTTFNDGFSYIFVSNYDAHEIFNMVRIGVKPDEEEFAKLMNNYTFPLHYDNGKSCEESDICSHPNIGTVRGGILTPNHWYLAHIVGIKSDRYIDNSTQKPINFNPKELYPRGEISDWNNINGHKIRKIDKTLSKEQKQLVIAHFLRFVDPLNYYVVPGEKYQTNDIQRQIGSADCMNNYMCNKFAEIYGFDVLKEYRESIMTNTDIPKSNGNEKINISYGLSIFMNTQTRKQNGNKYQTDKKLEIGAYYLRNKKSYVFIEENLLNLKAKKGFIAMTILKELGISGKHKGLLASSTIDDEIIKANGTLKETLTSIKEKGL